MYNGFLCDAFCRLSKKPLKSILKTSKEKGHHKKKKDTEPVFWSKNFERNKHGKEAIALANRVVGQTFVEVTRDRPQSVPVRRERKHSESSSHEKSPIDTPFDSNKKPKKGILKKKYIGADSGCVLDDINISEYFTSDKNDKLRRTKGHSAKSSSSVSSNHSGGDRANHSHGVSDIEARLDNISLGRDDSADNLSVKTISTYISDESDKTPSKSKSRSQRTSKSGSGHSLSKSPESPHRSSSHDINKERQTTNDSITSSSPGGSKGSKNSSTPVSRKIKGILKRNGKFSSSSSDRDPSWRHSLGSQSSNSSGDLLDFSYDSPDGDNSLSAGLPRPAWNTPTFTQLVPEDEGYTDVAELSIYHGESGRCDSLHSQDNSSDIMHKINMLDETYFEEGIHRSAVSADLFNPNEAQVVYKQALAICNKIS